MRESAASELGLDGLPKVETDQGGKRLQILLEPYRSNSTLLWGKPPA
jgi:hypothetical protein